MTPSSTHSVAIFSLALIFAGCVDPNGAEPSDDRALPIVSGSKLEEFVSTSELPVLVEFGVDYQCERCWQMKPSVVDLGERFLGRASVIRVDYNLNPGLVAKYGGTICPTYVFFQDGQPVRTESFPTSSDLLASHLESMTEPVE